MFLSCRVFRSGFLACVFAAVFCVSGAWAVIGEPCVAPDGNIVSCNELEAAKTASGIAGVSWVNSVALTKENVTNKIFELTSSSTDAQYPSASAVYSYVNDSVATKESTTNKVTSLTSSATNTQYPSALAVYSAVSERVSTSSAASQSMAGTYNVTGTLSVPDLPLPSEE